MAGNQFGNYFRIMSFGESHGTALGVVVDGVRPGLPIDAAYIQHELDRRRPGQSAVTTQRKEEDKVEFLSGVFEGHTTGMPICMVIWNRDQQVKAYERIKDLFRPGHAGYTYLAKFGVTDFRGGGRSSGRETAARVAAGAVAKGLLKKEGIEIVGYTLEAAGVRCATIDLSVVEKNPMRAADLTAAAEMERRILAVREEGDSVGGIVEVVARNVPAGIGDPVFDKLEADLAKALMSIGAVRGFEIGNGFVAASLRASENNDPIYREEGTGRIRTRTNNAGGIAGGISNGEEIVCRIAVKPPSSIRKEQETVSLDGVPAVISVEGRHDPCICPRIVPVAEAMVALTLIDHLTRQRLLRHESKIAALRQTIDLVDRNIVLLLAERQALVTQIGTLKKSRGKLVLDRAREQKVLRKQLPVARQLGLDPAFVTQLFRAIFRLSRTTQRRGTGPRTRKRTT